MSNRRAWLIPSGIFALISGAIICGACNLLFSRDPSFSSLDTWPQHLSTRIELKPTETWREVNYYPDGFTRMHAKAIESGGEDTQYWFRADGTMKRAQTTFPRSEQGILGLKRIAVIATDGRTYLSDLELNKAGQTVRTVDLLNPNKTVRRFYSPKGTLAKEEIFALNSSNWVKQEHTAWFDSGRLQETLKLGRNASYSKRVYDSSGVLASSSDLNEYAMRYSRVDFHPDGKGILQEILQETSTTTLKSFHSGNILTEERTWHGPVSNTSSMVKVKRFDQQGVITLEQYFMPAEGVLKPYFVTVFASGQPTLQFSFSTFGNRGLNNFTEYHSGAGDKGPYTFYMMRPDGTIESEMRVDKPGTPGTRKTYTSEPGKTVVFSWPIKQEWIEYLPVVLPEQVVKYHPPYPH